MERDVHVESSHHVCEILCSTPGCNKSRVETISSHSKDSAIEFFVKEARKRGWGENKYGAACPDHNKG